MVTDNSPSDKQQADAADKITDAESPKIVHRLPRTVRVGIKTVIKLKVISPDRMKEVSPDSDELDGLWHDRTHTIYILNTLSIAEQWSIYRHEMIHALHDIDRLIREGLLEEDPPNTEPKAAVPAPSKTPVTTSCVLPIEAQGTVHDEVAGVETAS